MDIGVICGVLAITAFLSLLLRQYRPELALAIGVLAGVAVSLMLIRVLAAPLEKARQLMEKAGLGGDTALLLIKSLGICLLTQLTADVCRDAGEAGLASRAELAGKAALLLLALPLFGQLLELALLLMKGGGGG
ncbi:MAG: stage III sporulation protein AD [Clostridia bacterium]|nr:stage III sporulation protein AD [Clostridia bacterium]